jgi:GDP-4-dehydro-6-deoxy-D-mannose reductase
VTALKKLLLTGANGFVGSVLLEHLLNAGYQVTCTTSSTNFQSRDYECINLDIRDGKAVENAVKKVKPTHLVHLAAISNVATSFSNPYLTWETNVLGTINLLEAIKSQAPDCYSLFVSSSEVYGSTFKSSIPLNEESKCLPLNPYAASKLATEAAIGQYFATSLRGVIARPFNHIGQGQSPDFVTASFAKQIAEIESFKQTPFIQVGNLDANRDFLDVNDVCHAYIKLLEHEDKTSLHYIYNICSGRPYQIKNLLEIMLSQSPIDIDIRLDQARLRPSDIPFAVGCNKRIETDFNWQPEISIEQTLGSLLNYWRERTKNAALGNQVS